MKGSFSHDKSKGNFYAAIKLYIYKRYLLLSNKLPTNLGKSGNDGKIRKEIGQTFNLKSNNLKEKYNFTITNHKSGESGSCAHRVLKINRANIGL